MAPRGIYITNPIKTTLIFHQFPPYIYLIVRAPAGKTRRVEGKNVSSLTIGSMILTFLKNVFNTSSSQSRRTSQVLICFTCYRYHAPLPTLQRSVAHTISPPTKHLLPSVYSLLFYQLTAPPFFLNLPLPSQPATSEPPKRTFQPVPFLIPPGNTDTTCTWLKACFLQHSC